jgi:alkanesulfonate monooxygenase SsuD/methylene tetrahydromethanopterin reductase-like flavin-dependent oxidoreductase (luciferase family)
MVALARDVDAAGWHAVYTCDHFMPYTESGAPDDGPVLECWTTLTALAGQTEHVRLGSLVMSITYRHPAVMANMAATLDVVTGGRVILGVGAGWQVNEHTAYGLELPQPRERIAALDEACAVITGLLRERRTTLSGTHYSLADAPCDPKPRQERLPLLVGSGGERFGLRVVARHADIWHSWMDAETLRRKGAIVDGYCAEFGRDPSTLMRSTGGTIDHGLDPTQIRDRLLGLAEAGAEEFILIDDASTTTTDQARRLVDSLSAQVLPALG